MQEADGKVSVLLMERTERSKLLCLGTLGKIELQWRKQATEIEGLRTRSPLNISLGNSEEVECQGMWEESAEFALCLRLPGAGATCACISFSLF